MKIDKLKNLDKMGKQLRMRTLEYRWKLLALLSLLLSLWIMQHINAQGWQEFDITNRCVKESYEAEVRCDFIDGLICVEFWFPDTQDVSCTWTDAEFNAEVVPGFPLIATAKPQGFIYYYCFYPETMKDSLCYTFTYDGICCDIKECIDIPPSCCQYRSVVHEEELACRERDGQTSYTKRFSFQPSDSAFLCNNFDVVLDPPIPADVNVSWIGYNYSVEVNYNEADIPPGTEVVCITVDFDNPLCCDITLCDSLNQCCERDMDWAVVYERVYCDIIRDGYVHKGATCFDIAIDLANSLPLCDTPVFLSNLPIMDGTFQEGFEGDGYYHFKGCLDPDLIDAEDTVMCYKLDFPYAPPDLVCCDIQGCIKVPNCKLKIWVAKTYCDEEPPSRPHPNGKKYYCVEFHIDSAHAQRVQCGILIRNKFIPADKCEVQYVGGSTVITSCIDTNRVPSGVDSLDWALKYTANNRQITYSKAIPIPICCVQHGYDISVWCDTSDNDSFNYCFRMEVFNWRECGRWVLNSNATLLDYDATITPQGNLIIEGCFKSYYVLLVNNKIVSFNGVCFELTSDNPDCCPLKACIPYEEFEPCCTQVAWTGEAQCDSFVVPGSNIFQKGYYFKIHLPDGLDCGGFSFELHNGDIIDGTLKRQVVGNDVYITGYVDIASVDDDELCFTVDFDSKKCCDIKDCISIRKPCCTEPVVHDSIECKINDTTGQKYWCVTIQVDDANDCGRFIFRNNAVDIISQTSYFSGGDLFIELCFEGVIGLIDTPRFCYRIDFLSPTCCDIERCLELPECCEEVTWKGVAECDTVHDATGNMVEAYCFEVVLVDAVDCDINNFGISNGDLISYDTIHDGGHIRIRGCVEASSVDDDELCFFVDFASQSCCDFRGCVPIRKTCCREMQVEEEIRCMQTPNGQYYCARIVVNDGLLCDSFFLHTNTGSSTYDTAHVDGDLVIEHCFHASSSLDSFCYAIDFVSEECCDVERRCVPLPPCCEDVTWKGFAECDTVHDATGNMVEAYCFEVVLVDAVDCDINNFGISNGDLISYDTIHDGGHIRIRGCVEASSVDDDELCFFVDFASQSCCDFRGCVPIRKTCCREMQVEEEIRCMQTPNGQYYCARIVVNDGLLCDSFFLHTNTGSSTYDTAHVDGDLVIEHCFHASSSLDSFCYAIDFVSEECCDVERRCVPLPPCCEELPWMGGAECDSIKYPIDPSTDGLKPIYSFGISFPAHRACDSFHFEILNGDLIQWMRSIVNGKIVIEGAVEGYSVADTQLCFRIDFVSDACCDIEGCIPIRDQCCKGYTIDETLRCVPKDDGTNQWCGRIALHAEDICDSLVFHSNAYLSDFDSAVHDDYVVFEFCFDSLDSNADAFCYSVDFLDEECCDVTMRCLDIPRCCKQFEWEGDTWCDTFKAGDHLIPAYCYKIVVIGAEACADSTVQIAFQWDKSTGRSWIKEIHKIGGNLVIKGCIPQDSVPSVYDSLCFTIDFPNALCCDLQGCLPRPTCADDHCQNVVFRTNAYCDTLVNPAGSSTPVVCYEFGGIHMNKCGAFQYRVTESTGDELTVIHPTVDTIAGAVLFKGCVPIDSLQGEKLCLEIDFVDSTCCDTTVCVLVPNCTTVNTSKAKDMSLQWVVYPNPTRDVLIIEANTDNRPYEVSLWNLYGHRILTQTAQKSKTKIDVHRLPRGVYLLRIRDIVRPDSQTHLRILLH